KNFGAYLLQQEKEEETKKIEEPAEVEEKPVVNVPLPRPRPNFEAEKKEEVPEAPAETPVDGAVKPDVQFVFPKPRPDFLSNETQSVHVDDLAIEYDGEMTLPLPEDSEYQI